MTKALLSSIHLLACLLMCCPASADEIQTSELNRYDMPRFPPELVGVKAGDGEVVMVVTIDSAGAVNDSAVLEATNEAFARSAVRAVSDWRFGAKSFVSTASALALTMTTPDEATASNPAVVADTETTFPRRKVLQFSFKRSGVVTTLSHAEAARENFVTTNIPQIRSVPWNQLDAEPQRLSATMPKVSKTILATQGSQPLMLNFVIDREGRVRVPVVPASVHPELANSLLAAVRTWRYSPPLYQQRPVVVEVTRALVLPQK